MIDPSVLEQYQIYKDQDAVEPTSAAILVLAEAVRRLAYAVDNVTDGDQNLNVLLSGRLSE